jgi:protein-tyrosine sulfotransferase
MTPTLATLWESFRSRDSVFEAYSFPKDDIDQLFRNLFYALVERQLRDSHKPRLAEKTPGNCQVFPQLRWLFPDSPLVHVIRDGRDVVASLLSQNWIDARTQKPMDVTVNPGLAAEHWVRSVTQGRRLLTETENNYLEVRYESLVAEPRTELERLFDFLGESFEEEVLGFHRKRRNLASEASANQVSKPLYKGSIGRWSKVLNLEQRTTVSQVAGDLLLELGYVRDQNWVNDGF